MVADPAAVRELKLALVGVKSAVKAVVAFTAAGVHEHVAVVDAAATAEHPEITAPPTLKATVPGVFTVAVIVTAVPYVAVVAPLGRARVRVGVAVVKVKEIAADVTAE